ncbi:hypothetical protein L6452_02890 [Arctium lappa]|uniref:Uncharacterized protein n=1 Tax=Arctium lappa TaxID=4217 RepID=A0ACB9FLQ0_ARCLA|nr:hypothetical protein L6452_02890 [Arctium lappa]
MQAFYHYVLCNKIVYAYYLFSHMLFFEKICITGTTTMLYVNSRAGSTLDPRPTEDAFEATTLIGLL